MMFPIREFDARFREILDALDEVCDRLDVESAEALEEMNAELEDALFLLSEIDLKGEDAAKELADAMEEFDALCEDYRGLSGRAAAIAGPVDRLERLVQMAKGNM